MNDMISALRARFPDMDEAEAKAVAGALMMVPFIANAHTRDAIREIAGPITYHRTRWDIEIAIARSAYAAGVKAERERCEKTLSAERRRATNAECMVEAYYNMLGPTGIKVADKWRQKGVTRVHFSWGDDAGKLTGEDRAQVILDMGAAPAAELNFGDSIRGDRP